MPGRSSDAVTAREARIIKKIEYYFSDVNLLKNKRVKKIIQDDDGWVTIDTILTFNRFKEVSYNAPIIFDVLKKSSSGLMEVSEQGDKIRRSPSKPLPCDTKERRKAIIDRTVFAKPFPLDVKLDDLLEFFEGYGKVDNVFMKKHFQTETFKGCVFVTFSNKEDAAKFVIEEETKFKEQALEQKCFKTDHIKHKAAQRKAKGKKDTEGKPHKKGEAMTQEEEAKADLEESVIQKMTKNAVLHLKGLNSKTSRQQVKAFFTKHTVVDWVEFDKGATEGYIRLKKPDSAVSTLEKYKSVNDGKVVIQGTDIEVRVVEGDEELQYWKKMFKDFADKKKGGRRGRKKGGRNHRGGRNKRDRRKNRGGPEGKRKQNKKEDSYGRGSDGQEQDTEEPPANFIKTEKIITRAQGKQKQNKNEASSDGEEQHIEEPPAKVTKFDKIITITQGKRKHNKRDASSDGEEQDTEEPPAKVTNSEKVITRPQSKRKQKKKPEDPLAWLFSMIE